MPYFVTLWLVEMEFWSWHNPSILFLMLGSDSEPTLGRLPPPKPPEAKALESMALLQANTDLLVHKTGLCIWPITTFWQDQTLTHKRMSLLPQNLFNQLDCGGMRVTDVAIAVPENIMDIQVVGQVNNVILMMTFLNWNSQKYWVGSFPATTHWVCLVISK